MTINWTHEFNSAEHKVTAKLPLKYTVDIYRRGDGDVQCLWSPSVPNFTSRHVRRKVLPAYQAAMMTFLAENSEAITGKAPAR
jgi:hypothetical protein